MSLGGGGTFEVDPRVKKILAGWGKGSDTEQRLRDLRRAASRLDPAAKAQLVDRLAEISLGVLFTINEKARRAEGS